MPRAKGLTAVAVARLDQPGRYGDGGGLYLQVAPGGTKSWLFRFMQHRRARQMGLGPVDLVTLAEARDKATACRKLLLDGIDPIEARHAKRAEAQISAKRGITFKDAAERYIGAHEAAWRNPKHRAQWRNTLATYVYPIIGDLSVAAIDTGLVLKCIEPVWTAKPETAGRIRGRIESVLDWASARGHRQGENPARWRGHLDRLLPAKSAVRQVRHHAALPYGELPPFVADLRARPGVSARALEITVLTALRTGSVIEAKWCEFDIANKTWTVPKTRMKWKSGQEARDFRVPLSERVLGILEVLPREDGSDFVFPGDRAGRPLSNMAMLKVLQRMGRADLTVHGFRSSFKDWASEATSDPDIVVEMALAHVVGDKVEAAYRRGDLFAKRIALMRDWERFVEGGASSGNIVRLYA